MPFGRKGTGYLSQWVNYYGGDRAMFRCDNCGSGYSMKAAASWESCPRCLAKERINVPLSFELGWTGRSEAGRVEDAQLEVLGVPSGGKASSAALK